ncbi:CopD family protein [Haloechinothrix sp. LS1_15]|uniref:copper resistance D family protein n=1 Tax=Haloechinothrix sp. LS1_15 TaxID=2652248 RepID=UPI00294B278B|nr:CopD family protein [Haloechinothrix sp. LS1_15]
MPRGRTAPGLRPAPLILAITAAQAGALAGIALAGVPAVTGISGPGAAVTAGVPVARALLAVAAIATVGLSLLPLMLRRERASRTEPVLDLARRAAVVTAACWALAATVVLALQAAELHGSDIPSPTEVRRYATEVPSGTALLIVVALATAHAALGVLAVRSGERVPAEVRTGLALFALLPVPVTGHAATWTRHEYLLVAIELHVLAATVWAGGLGAIVTLLATRRTLLAGALPRFSVLATACLAVTALTGVLSAFAELSEHPTMDLAEGVFGTGYGHLLLAKTVCLLGIALVGARLRTALLPRIARHSRTAFTGWASLELALMAVAFGLAAVLSRTPLG